MSYSLGLPPDMGRPLDSLSSSPGHPAAAAPGAAAPNDHFAMFRDLIGSTFLSDVSLRVSGAIANVSGAKGDEEDGEVHEVPAHRVVLGAISPYFRAMLSDKMFEESSAKVIDVPYDHETCFKYVLEYIYTGSLTDGFDAFALLDAACFYELDVLKASAVAHLRSLTTPENCFTLLDLSLRYNCPSLREHCVTLVRQHNMDVLDANHWLDMSQAVALLLVQETVIDGELEVLRACDSWCKHNIKDDEERRVEVFAEFLRFVDFTIMNEAEIDEVEAMGCVPMEVLYRAFKSRCLQKPATHVPRKGGIVLQWEMPDDKDVDVVSNHVAKVSGEYHPNTVCALNRFAKGRHYWTCNIVDLRTPHDCLVGVMHRTDDKLFLFEPCSMTVSSPPDTAVEKNTQSMTSILVEHCCVVGIEVDYVENKVRWYNHRTKELLFTAWSYQREYYDEDEGEEGAEERFKRLPQPLPSPLYPCTTLYHKSNGGVTLSETTTYLQERISLTASPSSLPGSPGSTRSHMTPKKRQ